MLSKRLQDELHYSSDSKAQGPNQHLVGSTLRWRTRLDRTVTAAASGIIKTTLAALIFVRGRERLDAPVHKT